jgi:hypothetical protein
MVNVETVWPPAGANKFARKGCQSLRGAHADMRPVCAEITPISQTPLLGWSIELIVDIYLQCLIKPLVQSVRTNMYSTSTERYKKIALKPVFVRVSFCIYLKQLKKEGLEGTVQKWSSVFIGALRMAKTLYCTLIKNKIKFSSYIGKFRVEQLQSHI